MEYLEQKALSTAPNPPKFWGRYVDDTFVIHKEANKQSFLQHINIVDPAIRFTVEDNKEGWLHPLFGQLLENQRLMVLCPSLYTGNLHIQTSIYSGTVTITSQPSSVSSKPSPIGLPQWCSNPELLQKEKQHLRKALTKCNYPKWALDKVEKRLNRSTRQVNDGGNNPAQAWPTMEVQSKGHIVIPYTQGLCESIKRSVVDMASKLTSRVAKPSKTFWSPLRTRTLCSTKVVPYTGTNATT